MFDQNTSSPFMDTEWMFDIRNGFDVVISNPPYVFTRDVDFSNNFKNYIDKVYFSKIVDSSVKAKEKQSGKINLFSIFILRGLQLCKQNGVLSYILPNNILRTTTYDIIRKSILDNSSIDKIVDLGSGVFEKVTASTIILQIRNVYNVCNKLEVISQVRSLEGRFFVSNYLVQNSFIKNPSYTFNIFNNDSNSSLLERIELVQYKLGDL